MLVPVKAPEKILDRLKSANPDEIKEKFLQVKIGEKGYLFENPLYQNDQKANQDLFLCVAQNNNGDSFLLKININPVDSPNQALSPEFCESTEMFIDEGKKYRLTLYPFYGETLLSYMKENKNKLEKSDTKSLMVQIAFALKKLHKDHIGHGNISPNNIVIDLNLNIQFINFEQAEKTSDSDKRWQDLVNLAGIFNIDSALINNLDHLILRLILNHCQIGLTESQIHMINQNKGAQALLFSSYQSNKNNINHKFVSDLLAAIPDCPSSIKGFESAIKSDYENLQVVTQIIKLGLDQLISTSEPPKAKVLETLRENLSQGLNRKDLSYLLLQIEEVHLCDKKITIKEDYQQHKITNFYYLLAKNLLNLDANKGSFKPEQVKSKVTVDAFKIALNLALEKVADDKIKKELITNTLEALKDPEISFNTVKELFLQAIRVLSHNPASWMGRYYGQAPESYQVMEPYFKLLQPILRVSDEQFDHVRYDSGTVTVDGMEIKTYTELADRYAKEAATVKSDQKNIQRTEVKAENPESLFQQKDEQKKESELKAGDSSSNTEQKQAVQAAFS